MEEPTQVPPLPATPHEPESGVTPEPENSFTPGEREKPGRVRKKEGTERPPLFFDSM